MKSFHGKVAAITGAGSGIGRALAQALAEQGCHLALADVNEAALAETAALLKQAPVRLSTACVDVANQAEVFAWAETVVSEHGEVNVLFNNAGVALSGQVEALSLDDYRWITDINYWGVVYGVKAFLPHLKASACGHIINISSVQGLASQPLMTGYNLTKYAVRGFTESLRQELDMSNSGVSATCVCPGGIKTNVARSARMSDSVSEFMGQDKDQLLDDFERSFFTTPEKAAATILKAVKRNRRRVLVGWDAHIYDWAVRLFPSFYQRIVVAVVGLMRKQ